VGYTNAGKSTLMNLLTGAGVLTENRLFSTLDTRTRKWHLGEGQTALLSDTVGFVRDLPHHLVASFRATLEEAIHADLLLHVADAAHDDLEHQVASVTEVLAELDCKDKDVILVLNKADRITDAALVATLRCQYAGSHVISATTAEGVEGLVDQVRLRMRGGRVALRLTADCRNGKLMQYLAQHAQVKDQTWSGTTVEMQAVMGSVQADQLVRFGHDVQVLERSVAE
jgi:GTP-binding protein HflX